MTYELFQQGPSVYIPILLLSIVITVVAYGTFPLIFAATRTTPIAKKKYKRLCYGINIAVMFMFIVINGEASSGGPYLLWTWIFSSWGTRILEDKGLLDDGTYIPSAPPVQTPQHSKPIVEADKICFCRKCGEKMIDNSKFCRKCGTEIVEVKNNEQYRSE